MPKKKTPEEFIADATAKHSGKYSYANTNYINALTKIWITCPNHGDFYQSPSNHLTGQGCPDCGNPNGKKDTTRFIAEAKGIHGEKYSYENTVYTGAHKYIEYYCNVHKHTTTQSATNHLKTGCNCSATLNKELRAVGKQTVRRKKANTYDYDVLFERFLTRARATYPNGKYGYEKVKYTNNQTKIEITCNQIDDDGVIHGSFFQIPTDHFDHEGCKQCQAGNVPLTTEEFIDRARKIKFNSKGGPYSYEKAVYKNNRSKVVIVCHAVDECGQHGDFEQTPYAHLSGRGCDICGGTSQSTTERFITKAQKIHGSRYTYDAGKYEKATSEIIITCAKHGEFPQQASNHLSGHGCPKCITTVQRSSHEIAIEQWLVDLGVSHRVADNTIIAPQHVDFYIPDHNLAIEFNGLYYHSSKFKSNNYHYKKWKACHAKNIRLLHINEDEWIARPEAIKSKILNLCGLSERGVGARKLIIHAISNKEAMNFCKLNHIQGSPQGCKSCYGAFDGDEMVAVMTFGLIRSPRTEHKKEDQEPKTELSRFCTNGKIYAGLFSKMFKYAVNEQGFFEVFTFADRRYSMGGLYEKTGFIIDGIHKNDYRYVKDLKTYSKQCFTKSNIMKKFGERIIERFPDAPNNVTEFEMTEYLGIHRIYDCGKMRFVWRPS